MTISAYELAAPSDLLERARELYRDLTVALHGRIARSIDGRVPVSGKRDAALIRAHTEAMKTVLVIEAGIGKRSETDGGFGELDLDTARAEILARLAVWPVEG